MRILKKSRQSNYLMRIMKTILMISMVPIIMLGIVSYSHSSNVVQENVLKVNEQLLVQTRMRFEQTLEIVYNYYVLLGNKEVITENLDRPLDYKDVDRILDIQTKLMEVQNIQSIVKNASLVNMKNDWVVSNENFSQDLSPEYRAYVQKGLNNSRSIFWQYDPENTDRISLFIKVPYNVTKHEGAMIVDCQYQEIKKFFTSNSEHEMLVLDETGHIVFSDNRQLLGKEGREYFEQDDLDKMTQERGYLTAFFGDEAFKVLYEKSGYNGWTYLMLYSIDELTNEVTPIRLLTVGIVLSLLVIIVILSIFGSKKLYSPVKDIYHSIQQIDESQARESMDEMMYIGREIHSMIGRQEKMQQRLDRQIRQIEELFMLKLIKGELKEEQILQRARHIGKFLDYTFYSVMTLQIEHYGDSEGRVQDEEIRLLLLYNSLLEYLEQEPYLTPIIRDGVCVLLLDGHNEEAQQFKESSFAVAYSLQQKIQERLDFEIIIGLSNRYINPELVQVAYKESLEALMCKDVKNNTILFYEEVQPGKVIRVIYPKNLEDELIQVIKRGESHQAEIILDQMIEQIFNSYVGYNEHKVYVNRLLIALVNQLQDSGISVQNVFDKTDNVLEEIISLTHKEEIKGWFKTKLIQPMVPLLKQQRTSANYVLIQEIIQMIEQEYDKDISLEICADRLNYHPSYIWKVMKQELNTSFTDYLMNYRLEQAKRMLINTDETIKGISEKLRYTNAQNFIRYFKKLEGMTPGQYRKKFQV